MNISDLLGLIAKPTRLPDLADSAATTIVQPAIEPLNFVEPAFNLGEASSQQVTNVHVPDVLLISAPAAVGKSWLARAISARSGNALWDLSRFRLGSHFFTGTLAQSYGGPGFVAMEQALRSGEATVVLDAADEAVVGSGLSNFQAALADLARIITGENARDRVAAVILGRPDTLEIAGVLLTENAVSWQVVTVDYFSEPEAKAFVLVKSGNPAGAARNEVERFVDDFFATVSAALDEQGLTHAEFLGYAPVLDALSGFYVNEPNPHATFQELKRDSSRDYVWQLLRDVVSTICSRETEKFIRAFSGDRLAETLASELYSFRSQMLLLSATDLAAVQPRFPANVPEEVQGRIIAAWNEQVSEHPFLRRQSERSSENPFLRFAGTVFRDFVAAECLFMGDTFDVIANVQWLLDEQYVPSPVLARFVVAKIRSGNEFNVQALPALLDSLSADATSAPLRVFVDEGVSEAADDELEISLFVDKQVVVNGRCLQDGLQPIQLGSSLARVSLDLPQQDIEVSPLRRDLRLGEEIKIVCRNLTIDASDVRVQCDVREPVTLSCSRFSSRSVRVYAPDKRMLTITSGSLKFPWIQFASGELERESEVDLWRAGLRLRRLYKWFSRASMTGRLTYPRDAFDTIVAKGRAHWGIFQFLQNQDILELRGNIYHLNEPIPTMDVLALDLNNPDLRQFLRRYLDWESIGD